MFHMSGVTCQVSHVRCHMSGVTCHMSTFFFFSFRKSGEASLWRVCYQRGLPHLVYINILQWPKNYCFAVMYITSLQKKWREGISHKISHKCPVNLGTKAFYATRSLAVPRFTALPVLFPNCQKSGLLVLVTKNQLSLVKT